MSYANWFTTRQVAPRRPWCRPGGRTVVTASVAALAAVGAAACGGDGVTAPSASAGAPRVSAYVGISTPRTLTVCKAKSSPAGTYTFTISGQTGSINPGDVAGPTPFTLTVAPGATADACTVIYTRTQSQSASLDPRTSLVVTELAAPGTTLANITGTGGGGTVEPGVVPPPVVDVANRRVTLSINAFHDESATFFNVAAPSQGCTYTQGYYKNKGSDLLPAGEFFSSGKTYLQILDTPPRRGNGYIILAHQYIAASLNVQYGASAPTAVTNALFTAKAYFSGSVQLSNSQLVALADILDAYNNGKTGPGHCS